MKKNKSFFAAFCLIFVASITHGCVNDIPEYKRCLSTFDVYYTDKKVTNHFPVIAGAVRHFYCCSLSKEVDFAEVYLTTNSNKKDIELLKAKKYQFVDYYSSYKFFEISIDLIRDSLNIYSTQIKNLNCNFPIGNFKEVNFGLGESKDSFFVKEKSKFQIIYKYNVPEDLEVFVIDTMSGNFFTNEVSKHKRFSLLGKWRNGFSRGIAISEKYNIITYWLIVW